MDIQEYYDTFMRDILDASFEANVEPSTKFLQRALDIVVDSGSIDDYNFIHTSGKESNRWQLDAWFFDERFNSLHLIGLVFDETDQPKPLSQADVDRMLKKLNGFLERAVLRDPLQSFDDGTDIQRTAVEIKRRWETVSSVSFSVISNRTASSRFKKIDDLEVSGVETKIDIWEFNRFYNFEMALTEREQLLVEIPMGQLPCIKASASDVTETYLCVMPASLLVSIYETWTSRVLEQNVRSFLQYRGKINKGIKLTIDEDPHHFFAYNNGLTTTARSVSISEDGRFLTNIEDLQIVNGGQTTAALHQAFKEGKDLSNITVQMKLTVVDGQLSPELVPNIAKFANSQNPVSAADLFSNHPFHIRLESISRRTEAPPVTGSAFGTKWFYERSRGQYLNEQRLMKASERREFQRMYPRQQLITKTDLALSENCWECLPHEVSKGAQANFKVFAEGIDKQWQQDDSSFNEQYYEEACARLLIQRGLRTLVMAADWYAGYPANITAYTIAWAAHTLKQQQDLLDFARIWRSQRCPAQLEQLLTSAAKRVNTFLQASQGNVTTYSKNSRTFSSLLEKEGMLDCSELKPLMVSRTESKERKRDSRSQQALDTELLAESELMMISEESWNRVVAFLKSNDLMTPETERSIQASKQFQPLSKAKREKLSALVNEYKHSGGTLDNRQVR